MKKILNLLFLYLLISFPVLQGSPVSTILGDCLEISSMETIGGAYLTFAGKFGGEIDRVDLSSHQKIGIEGCAKGSKIFQYTLYVMHDHKTTIFKGNSSNLNHQVLSLFKQLNPGDKFHFEKIKATLPTGRKVDVVGRKFTIV